MNSISQGLARFASTAIVPDRVLIPLRDRFLDTIGVSLAALNLETSTAVLEHAYDLGGTPQASIIGSRTRIPAPAAAFANGVLAHSLDYDDTHLPSILHPSASIIPAVLATAQMTGASGTEALRAAAIGIEICCRLGLAGYSSKNRSSLYFERGQHATSICGAVAGAVASALLMGADEAVIADAIGLAVSMGSGVIEANRSGGTVKRLHCGFAAQSAVTAAMLARRGITGPSTSLEGRFGFFQAWIDGNFDPEPLTEGLGEHWETAGLFYKPYPCNHFTQTGIDAAIRLRESGLRIHDISALTLGVASQTVRTIGEPLVDKQSPTTGYLAKFSGPYTIAAALLGGGGLGLGLDDFTDELVRDAERRALMHRITVIADEHCDSIYPDQFPATLTAHLKDGSTLTERVLTNRGGPERPLSTEELLVKFRDCAGRVLSAEGVAQVESATANFDNLTNVEPLLDATAKTSRKKSRSRRHLFAVATEDTEE